MDRPSIYPEWASDVAAEITEPNTAKKESGWVDSEKPPHDYFNWFQNLAYQWIGHLDEKSARAGLGNFVKFGLTKDFELYTLTRNTATGQIVVAGKRDGTDAAIYSSEDNGATWTERANPKNFSIRKMIWVENIGASGTYFGVGAADGTDAYMIKSTDGATWTEIANPKNFQLNDILYDVNTSALVAVGAADGTDAYIIRSTDDGANWTEIANAKNNNLYAIAMSETVIIAAGESDGADTYLLKSSNGGAVWTEIASSADYDMYDLVYSPTLDMWVGVGENTGVGAGPYIATSTSQESSTPTFTQRKGDADCDLMSVCEYAGVIVACGTNPITYAEMQVSITGHDYSSVATNIKTNIFCADVLGGELWVCGGDGDSENIVAKLL